MKEQRCQTCDELTDRCEDDSLMVNDKIVCESCYDKYRTLELLCTCQACKNKYTYDLIVNDELWKQISPESIDGWETGGLLCPECIVERITKLKMYNEEELIEAFEIGQRNPHLTKIILNKILKGR